MSARRLLPVILLCLGVFTARLAMFSRSPEPNGADGYFYAMEARSFMERGYLENFSLSPPYYFCGILAFLARDPVLGVRLCSALFSALLPLGMFLLAGNVPRSNKLLPVFVAALAACSPSLVYMSVNYIANLCGLCLGIFSLAQFGRAVEKPGVLRFLGFAVLAILAALSHMSVAVYLAASLSVYALSRIGKPWIIALMALGFLAGGIVFREQLNRFAGVFALGPVLPALSPVFRMRLPAAVSVELTILMLAAYGSAIVAFLKTCRFEYWFLLVPVFYFPFWNLSSLDMGFRLMLAAGPAGILFFAYALQSFAKGEKESSMRSLPKKGFMSTYGAAGTAVLCALSLAGGIFIYDPRRDPPYAAYKRVVEPIELPDDSLLIAHIGLNHVYTYAKKFRDALNYVPDFPVLREQLWRIAHGVSWSLLAAQYSVESALGLLKDLPGDYVLIREDLWQAYLAGEEPQQREALRNWYNPYSTRPAFIRGKK